ncbi:MoaD/ThiS family protein [Jonesiaceae bacterium BS-20]|uniref:MoaD/ThiS family protein n=1 Tax=Jonesiaceae bacterium BS-20 TaxID=3120821 RepID=A0AAU7DZH0_9MICO
MFAVTVRYFAAARAAAGGTRQEVIEAATPAQAFELAAQTHGSELARIIGISSYLLDGVSLAKEDSAQQLSAPVTLDIMPPFAGG